MQIGAVQKITLEPESFALMWIHNKMQKYQRLDPKIIRSYSEVKLDAETEDKQVRRGEQDYKD